MTRVRVFALFAALCLPPLVFAQSGPSLPSTCALADLFSLTGPVPPIPHRCAAENVWVIVVPPELLAPPTDTTDNNVTTSAHGLTPKLSGVSTHFLNGIGTYTVPAGGGGGGATKLVVAVNQQNTTTTFANVTGLTMAVATATRYVFDCVLTSTTAVSTTATQIAVNGPTTSSLRYTVDTATSATATHRATQTAYDAVTNPATGAAAVPLPVYLRGQFLTTAAGTFAVRVRSEIAASAVNVLAGSYCLVQ